MKNALRKDFWMEIKKSKARFISIFCIVALGVAFFSGIQATSPDMRSSGDAFFDEKDLMDIKVMSSMGLTEKDIEALNDLDGVESAEGAYFTDVLCGDEGAQKVLHVESVNETVNRLTVEEGRIPEKRGEIFLDAQYAKREDFRIGDRIAVRQEEDQELLLTEEYEIVGYGGTPLYISSSRGNTNVGSGEISGFAYVLPEDFDQEVYTQAYLRVHGAEGLTSYTDAYDNLVDKIEKRVEGISAEQCQRRLDEIVAEAQDELDDAKEELEKAKEEVAQELADAAKELKDGEKELEDGEKELEDGIKELEDGKKEYENGLKELEDARAEIASGWQQISDARAQLDSGWSQLSSAKQQIQDGWAELTPAQKELENGWKAYKAGKKEYNKGVKQLEDTKNQLAAGAQEIANGKAVLETKQAELDAAKIQAAEGKVQAEAAIVDLNAQKPQVEQALAVVLAAEAELPGKQAAHDGALAVVTEKQTAVANAQTALDAARTQVEEGTMLPEDLASYENALQTANGELEAANSTYGAAQAELAQCQQIVGGKGVLEENLAMINGGIAQAEQTLAELAAAEAQFGPAQAAIDEGWVQLQAQEAALSSAREQIAAGEKEMAAAKKELNASKKQLDAAQAEIDANVQKLNAAQAEINANEQTLNSSEAQLAASRQELVNGEAELANGEAELAEAAKEIADAEKELEDGKKELEDGKKELEDGKKEYEDGKKEAEAEIADAEKEIADAEKEIADLELPEWYISDRGELPEYTDYGDNANRIRSLGEVFPVIFFLVAALISLTTMTRMVEEQRTQIGTLKALGYGKYAIASKFLNYAFLATIGGSILGFLIGQKIIPYVIITAYGIVYRSMSVMLNLDYQVKYAVIAAAASIVCTVGATLFSCYKVLMETPASLMRPPAPKEGKRILIERITFLWKHLNFTWKSSLRNLFRYKKRLFMTIFGISGSMGLMLVGFGIQDSVGDISAKQFTELQHYHGIIISDEEASDAERKELREYLDGNEKMEHYSFIQFGIMEAPREKSQLGVYVYVPENPENFPHDITLKDRITQENYVLTDEGVVISEKTGKLLNLEVGDLLTLEKEEKQYQIPVTAITENYMAHYAYMTPVAYEKTFGESAKFADVVFTMKEEYKDELEKTGQEILEYPAALSISYSKSVQATVDQMLVTLGSVIIVLIISAGLLAFVVLYNLNNINITERQRELATLKVLGFYDGEVSAYVFRENIVLTILGILFGAVLGFILHRYVILTVEVDSIMFGRIIAPTSYAYCAVITAAFSAMINWIMHHKLKKIDMVESLKSVE